MTNAGNNVINLLQQFVINLPDHIESMKINKFLTNEDLLTEMLALAEDFLQNYAD